MIENLNSISFNKYGSVTDKGVMPSIEGETETGHIEIKTVNIKNLYKCSKKIMLQTVEGIGLLYISGKTFLLDKPVTVNPGISFGVFTLYGACRVFFKFVKGASLKVIEHIGSSMVLEYCPKINISKILTLFYHEKEKGFIFKGEKHDFWELTYVDQGTIYTIIDEKGYILDQGDMILYARNQHHVQWADEGESVCFVTISFQLDSGGESMVTDKKLHLDTHSRKLVSRIVEEKDKNALFSEDLIICLFKELLISVIRHDKLETAVSRQDSHIKDKLENYMVSRCIDYIIQNIDRKITLSEAASSIPISQSYLSSLFKKHTGVTVVDYVNSYRLDKARELIRNSKYNMTQIALKLGFNSVHYFSNQFKAQFGIRPTEYAKSIRK